MRVLKPSLSSLDCRALTAAYVIIAAGYGGVAFLGFAFFGNKVTGNVMQSLPYAVPTYIANGCVVLHVAAAYQVCQHNVCLAGVLQYCLRYSSGNGPAGC